MQKKFPAKNKQNSQTNDIYDRIKVMYIIKISFTPPFSWLHCKLYVPGNRSCKAVKKKILVIDDSSTNIVLLNAVLIQNGYEVITALNAKEAFHLLEKESPDLILLDLLMPEISGFDFLDDIKHDRKLKDIPVVIVSAVGTKENIHLTQKLGAVSFISKPIDIDQLLATVTQLLEQ